MTTTAIGASAHEAVRFRVRRLGLSRAAPGEDGRALGPYRLVLWIAFADRPGAVGLPVERDEVAPYAEAIAEAERTQAVYRVEWGGESAPNDRDRPLGRVLRALLDRRFATGEGEGESDARA